MYPTSEPVQNVLPWNIPIPKWAALIIYGILIVPWFEVGHIWNVQNSLPNLGNSNIIKLLLTATECLRIDPESFATCTAASCFISYCWVWLGPDSLGTAHYGFDLHIPIACLLDLRKKQLPGGPRGLNSSLLPWGPCSWSIWSLLLNTKGIRGTYYTYLYI